MLHRIGAHTRTQRSPVSGHRASASYESSPFAVVPRFVLFEFLLNFPCLLTLLPLLLMLPNWWHDLKVIIFYVYDLGSVRRSSAIHPQRLINRRRQGNDY